MLKETKSKQTFGPVYLTQTDSVLRPKHEIFLKTSKENNNRSTYKRARLKSFCSKTEGLRNAVYPSIRNFLFCMPTYVDNLFSMFRIFGHTDSLLTSTFNEIRGLVSLTF